MTLRYAAVAVALFTFVGFAQALPPAASGGGDPGEGGPKTCTAPLVLTNGKCVACGQYEDGHRAAAPPEPAQNFEPIEPGQPHVEYDQIVRLGREHVVRLIALGHAVDGIVRVSQRTREAVSEHGIVFDYQYSHRPN